jgi:C4-dicarboxylate-specific signal transduction histidine kinase
MTAARALARAAQEILRSPKVDFERADSNLTTLVVQIDHAGAVVRRMREFLRRGQPHFSTLDVKALLDGALVLARPEAVSHGISINLDVADALPAIFADSIQLQQVVLNLVRNAADSIAESRRRDGRIHVRAYLADQGDRVEISVTDNGVGIPAGWPLFDPLSTSKSEGLA